MKRRDTLFLVALAMVSAGSCEGCPGRELDPLREFGTLNPLFDRVAFPAQPGRVVSPT